MEDTNIIVAFLGVLVFIFVTVSKFQSVEIKIASLNDKIKQQSKLIEELKDKNTYQDIIINKLNADYNLKHGIK